MFGTGDLRLIQINHQPDATIFQFIILTFVHSSSCFGAFSRPSSGAQRLWWQPLVFYLLIVVTVVLFSWSGQLTT
jgi:hypothetical protein